MKITLQELREAHPALIKLAQKEMPFKLSYRLKKITKKVLDEVKEFEEARNELVKKYGEKNKDGSFSVKPKNMETFLKELTEALKEEIEINIDLIPHDLFETLNVSAMDLIVLEKLMAKPVEPVTR